MKLLIMQNRKEFVFAIFAIILNSILNILQAALLGVIFDHLQNVMQPWLLGMIAGYLVLVLVCSLYIDLAKEKLKENIRQFLVETRIAAYMDMNEQSFAKSEMSTYINEMTTEVDLVIDQYVTPLLNTFALVASFVLGSIYFIFLDWRMLAFLYFGSMITLWLNKMNQSRLAKNQERILKTKKEWIKALQGFYRNFSAIKDYNLEDRERKELNRVSKDHIKACFIAGIDLAHLDSIDLEIGFVLFFGLILLCGTLFSGSITAGIAVTAIQLSNSIVNPIINFTTIWNRLNSSRPILDRFLANEKSEVSLPLTEIKEPAATIEIDAPFVKVNDTSLLHDIHLRFEKGKKYMIVGPSGCGKTTLLHTLKGTIPSSYVFINGKKNQSMKNQLCVVDQHPALFPWSLEQNIALNRSVSSSALQVLLEKVQLSHLDPKRSMKLDHETLSGGEMQRIHLARVLAQKRPWIFLDEAFSALDYETTCELEKLYVCDPGLSVISVCHKPVIENILYYDEIIVMEKGTVKEVLAPKSWQQKYGNFSSQEKDLAPER